MFIDDDELRSIFKTTSEEHLQNLDSGLLHLEKYADDQATLEWLLREAHSLKGDANMLGVKDIGTLAHQVEHILTQVKQREIPFSAELGDRLSYSLAAIRKLVQEAVTGEPTDINSFQVLATLMGAGEPRQGETFSEDAEKEIEDEGDERVATDAVVSEGLDDQSASLLGSPSPPIIPQGTIPSSIPHPPLRSQLASTADTYRIETIRVATHNLDHLMTQAGELTVTKIRIARRLAEIEAIATLWDEWSRDLFHHSFGESRNSKPEESLRYKITKPSSTSSNRAESYLKQMDSLISSLRSALNEDTTRLDLISGELEEGIRALRLLPFSTIFNLFPRMVHDLARQEGKQVELIIEGGKTCADKHILEEMKDPLMHLLRNAIDHGIEFPSERERLGKPTTATIHLRSYQTATHIVIEIEDDGRGLDLDRIKQTALKQGICREEDFATMLPGQIQSMIFTPGFSTAPLVTEVSGRGVGLDVVQTNVEKLKGRIQVESGKGQGCLFRVQLGITLATAHVLIVLVNDIPYAIPVEFIRMACLVNRHDIFTLEGQETMIRDGKPISVARLADLLELPTEQLRSPNKAASAQQFICLILQVGREELGVLVDAVVDEQDVVIKPQSQLLKRVRNVSGATILGTGEVCIVLNPQDLIRSMQRHSALPHLKGLPPLQPELDAEKQTILLVEDSIATRTQEKRMLESAGYEVVTAVDGSDGLTKLFSRSFDAIISDVQMPNLDGLQLTRKIRQHHEYDDLPIILVTSLASDEDKRRGAEAGANAYITKSSLNHDVLLETLHRLM